MPHLRTTSSKRARQTGPPKRGTSAAKNVEPRFSVALPHAIAGKVERYAETVDTSMSKAIAALVRLGLESQENRKQEFFKKLKENLDDQDPTCQNRLIDEFRALILGR